MITRSSGYDFVDQYHAQRAQQLNQILLDATEEEKCDIVALETSTHERLGWPEFYQKEEIPFFIKAFLRATEVYVCHFPQDKPDSAEKIEHLILGLGSAMQLRREVAPDLDLATLEQGYLSPCLSIRSHTGDLSRFERWVLMFADFSVRSRDAELGLEDLISLEEAWKDQKQIIGREYYMIHLIVEWIVQVPDVQKQLELMQRLWETCVQPSDYLSRIVGHRWVLGLSNIFKQSCPEEFSHDLGRKIWEMVRAYYLFSEKEDLPFTFALLDLAKSFSGDMCMQQEILTEWSKQIPRGFERLNWDHRNLARHIGDFVEESSVDTMRCVFNLIGEQDLNFAMCIDGPRPRVRFSRGSKLVNGPVEK